MLPGISTQSYEKIHRMEAGMAQRTATISVERSATLLYLPLPSIPFADSAFTGETYVQLADSTSRLALFDAVTCGRWAMGERFAYRIHHSRTRIYRGDCLVYRDEACYEPERMPMDDAMGFYEGYSCAASLLLFGWEDAGPLLEEQLQGQEDGISWGARSCTAETGLSACWDLPPSSWWS